MGGAHGASGGCEAGSTHHVVSAWGAALTTTYINIFRQITPITVAADGTETSTAARHPHCAEGEPTATRARALGSPPPRKFRWFWTDPYRGDSRRTLAGLTVAPAGHPRR